MPRLLAREERAVDKIGSRAHDPGVLACEERRETSDAGEAKGKGREV
jgi:hypothetical protein